jgi:mannose-6-phosphate isomerase-like protein (cupin superfamily)
MLCRVMSTSIGVSHLETARLFAGNPDDWPLAPRFDPTGRWYHRLAEGDGFEVWLLTWLPGQGTDLHDHGGSSGAFAIVSGLLTEETVVDVSGRVTLSKKVYRAGDSRAFGPYHVHRITNASRGPAVSVHVYGPALRSMTRYRLDGHRLQPMTIERAGVDW